MARRVPDSQPRGRVSYPERHTIRPPTPPEEDDEEGYEIPLDLLAVFCPKCRTMLHRMGLVTAEDMRTLEKWEVEDDSHRQVEDSRP